MRKIFVTKTFLPDIKKYINYLEQVWASGQLTNQGPFLRELESKLRNYVGTENFHFLTNGTVAIQLALNALDIKDGEIITTPFSYVATISSILWERCTPVFVDIDKDSLCIDALKIEQSITDKTKAILAVHVFGMPCNVEVIEKISEKHHIKIIYDGAHAFGVKYKKRSLLTYGDVSTCSFHSTKLFHTIEGGCLITKDKEVSDKVELIKRFGHNVDEHLCLGINAKASEFQAIMGLCNIEQIELIISERKKISEQYSCLLTNKIWRPVIDENVEYNYSYYPVVFENEAQAMAVMAALNAENISPRRYFFPSLNTLPYLNDVQRCPVSESISLRILCLPLYVGLESNSISLICKIINKVVLSATK